MEVCKVLPFAPHCVLSALHFYVFPSSGIIPADFVAPHVTSVFGQLSFCLFSGREGGGRRGEKERETLDVRHITHPLVTSQTLPDQGRGVNRPARYVPLNWN